MPPAARLRLRRSLRSDPPDAAALKCPVGSLQVGRFAKPSRTEWHSVLQGLGNPWFRLLRHEVEALVTAKSGKAGLDKKKLQKELADLNKEARKIKIRLKAIERRQAELTKELDG